MTSEVDQNVGFWIKNVPYIFIEGKGEDSKDPEKGKRLYFGKVPIPAQKKEGCGWVANYLGATAVVNPDIPIYRNGRNYYGKELPIDTTHSLDEVVFPIPNDQRSLDCQDLAAFGEDFYDISALVCAQMKETPDSWYNLMKLLQLCPPVSECDPCTRIGSKIAKSLIRIASTRIFADPEQSIMELPVNSVDAYATMTGQPKIGKFGMGFFSMFYWLIGHPKRSLHLESYSRDENGYCTYELIIKEVKGVLGFSVKTRSGSNVTERGTWVYVDAKEDEFTLDEVDSFYRQLEKLQYVPGIDFRVRVEDIPDPRPQISPTSLFRLRQSRYDIDTNRGTNAVCCVLAREYLSVEDFATGVPIDVTLGSLMVPSVSTKTLKAGDGPLPPYTPKSRLEYRGGNKDALLMNVGGVSVVSIQSKDSFGNDFIIDLPPGTGVPVSRDDIILSPTTKDALDSGIATLFAAEEETGSVVILQRLLKQYALFTANYNNRLAVQAAEMDYYVANKHRLIPIQYEDVYSQLQSMSGNKTRFIRSDRYDSTSLERWLDVNIKGDDSIWYGVKVVVLNTNGSPVADAGLATYLFIDEKYKRKLGAGWVQTITSSYNKLKLYPKSGLVAGKQYEKFADLTTGIKASLLPITNALLLKVETLSIYFEYSSFIIQANVANALIRYSNFFSEDQYTMICNEAIKKMSTFIGNQTYGGSKNYLFPYIIPNPYNITMISEYKLPEISMEKCKDLLYQHIIYTLRSIPEEPMTYLGFETVNSPFSMYKRVKDTTPGKELFQEIVVQSNDLIEMNALFYGCFADLKVYNTPIDNPREAARAFISHFLESVRGRKYDGDTIVHDYKWWSPHFLTDADTTRKDYITDRYMANTWSRTMQRASSVGVYTPPTIPQANSIRLSKLIKYLFEHPLPTEELKDNTWLAQVAASDTADTPLQIIEIAINEGTTKPPIEATLTELVQNSIDAIREAKSKEKKWDRKRSRIDINLKTTADKSSLVLQIIDRVGMSSEAFISVAIPFLSTKTPSELVTGEMGSGFFNAYREASQLDINSVRDGVTRWSIDVPVRDSRGRVIDIQKNMGIHKSSNRKASNGTTIAIHLPVKDSFDYVTKISKIAYFSTKVLGLVRDADINFNDSPADIVSTLGGKFGHYEVYYSDRGSAVSYESYLLTKGIPFAPLVDYMRDTLEDFTAIKTSVFVNITHGGYTPVQTRTRIKLARGEEGDFRSAALCTGFVGILTEMSKGRRIELLDHMASTGDARQLRFILYGLEFKPSERNLIKYGKIYPNTPPIAQILNECIDIMEDSTFNDAIKKKVDALLTKYSTSYAGVDNMIQEVIYQWLSKKNTSMEKAKEKAKAKAKKAGVEVDEEEKTDPDPASQPLVEKWVSTYLDIAAGAVKGFKPKKRPKIRAVKSTKTALGWFDPGSKTVYINTIKWDTKDRVAIEKLFAKKSIDGMDDALGNNKVWKQYFAFSFPSTTMPHELEHVRRNSSHDGSHDSAKIKLPDQPEQKLTFDQCANGVYQYVLSQGFYEKLFAKF